MLKTATIVIKDIRCFGFVYSLLPYKETVTDLKNAKY